MNKNREQAKAGQNKKQTNHGFCSNYYSGDVRNQNFLSEVLPKKIK